MGKKYFFLSLLIGVFFFIGNSNGYCQENLVGTTIDWRAQDYYNSQGITAVRFDQSSETLVLNCDYKGGDPSLANGEIILDLNYVPYVKPYSPVDMIGRKIEAEIEIPQGFIGSPSNPNGCQVFVKDNNYQSQYGTWVNCVSAGIVKVSLQPSYSLKDAALTTAGFNPSQIRTIGIKLAINSTSTHKYKGTITIRKITVTPSLPRMSRPALPSGAPISFVKGDSVIKMKSNGFYAGNKKWYITGGNWSVIEYRQNFGATAWFPKGNGISAHPGYIADRLELFRQAGITLVRVGLLDDGAAVLDKDCNVTGYNTVFRNDVSTFLSLASLYNIKVEFTLVDYLIAGKQEKISNVWLKGRRNIIESPSILQKFIKDFLSPFLSEFGDHPALFGFDIINEPEWIISKTDGGAWEEDSSDMNTPATPISYAEFKNFISLCAEEIHSLAPGKFVTMGVSCPNIKLLDDTTLDYAAKHYYEWMGSLGGNLDIKSWHNAWNLEEFPGKGDIVSYFETAYEKGAAGAFMWNLTPELDTQCYSYEDEESKLLKIRGFIDMSPAFTPEISLDKTQFYFGADTSGKVTGSQALTIDNKGGGAMEWEVSCDSLWVTCSPGSGVDAGVTMISVNPAGLAPGQYTALVTIKSSNAINSPQTVSVILNVIQQNATTAPFGEFATPVNMSNVSGSIAVTGWALDDIGISSVKIYRESESGHIYIGDAVFVEGARPDVEAAFPGYPFNSRAGWGYMLLTHFFPNKGNGSFTLSAVAVDIEGNEFALGSKTVGCDNAHAVKPFGAIDTPSQGGVVSGNNYRNQGWILTPTPNKIPEDGSTIKMYIDGKFIGRPHYNIYRSDIAELFPGYANSNAAFAYYDFDTSDYENGIHTIAWTATDNAGNTDGIGSRYFIVQNFTQGNKNVSDLRSSMLNGAKSQILTDYSTPVRVKKGFDDNIEPQTIYSDEHGVIHIELKEMERVEVYFGSRIMNLSPLPIGSTLDKERGVFYWQPGPGFIGKYRFEFMEREDGGGMKKNTLDFCFRIK